MHSRNPALNYFWLWWLAGWILVIVVIYLSLTASPPNIIRFTAADKIGHIMAYFTLMFWFAQLYVAKAIRLRLVIGFITMGVGLEILQGMGGHRFFEYWDMLANTLGVVLGWWLSVGFFNNIFGRVENYIRSAVSSK